MLLGFLESDFKIANRSRGGALDAASSTPAEALPLLTVLLDDAATTFPAGPGDAADFFFPEFNIAMRSEEGTDAAACWLPLTVDLVNGILAVTASGGAEGAIDITLGDEELVLEWEEVTAEVDVCCTGCRGGFEISLP